MKYVRIQINLNFPKIPDDYEKHKFINIFKHDNLNKNLTI